MRFGRLLPALSVSVAAGALIVLTGTGAAATEPGRSAPAAITGNLAAPTALIAASGGPLVTQRGARNYAGPNCPGKGWNCTTSTRVLQISTSGGQNRVDCPRGTAVPGTAQSCVITQMGSNNLAYCYQRSTSSTAEQNCSITQTGKRNVAHVNQSVNASNSDTQSATQSAVVDQTSSGSGFLVGNLSLIDQSVKQSTGPARHDDYGHGHDDDDDDDDDEGGGNGNQVPSALQQQDADQDAEVTQTAAGRGDNYSHVHQSQRLSARNGVSQNQNTLGGASDCVGGFPFSPNACASINQSGANGSNTSFLKQTIREDAKTAALLASQQQGSFNGGIDGYVHQDLAVGSPGRSRSNADQDKRQDLDAPDGTTQQQWDPLRCCGTASQINGSNNSEQIGQRSTQDASDSNANQDIAILGESFSPQGRCSVNQEATQNGASADNSGEANPCAPPINVITFCETGQSEGGCQELNNECVFPFCGGDLRQRTVFSKPRG